MEHGPDKQKEQLEKEFTECEEQEEDNMEDEAREGDELIVNKGMFINPLLLLKKRTLIY